MQPIDALTLKHLASDWQKPLTGAKITKIYQPSPHEVLLHLWGGKLSKNSKLYINVHPQFSFCSLLYAQDVLEDLVDEVFDKPTQFCMLLRKHITNARITQIKTLSYERVLNLTLESYNELGQQTVLILSLELMGKQANAILYNTVDQIILGCLHPVTERMSRLREVAIGLTYLPPPVIQTRHPEALQDWATFQKTIQDTSLSDQTLPNLLKLGLGLGKVTALQLISQSHSLADLYHKLLKVQDPQQIQPAISQSKAAYTLLSPLTEASQWQERPNVSELIHDYGLFHLKSARTQHRQRHLTQVLTQEKKRREDRLSELEPISEADITALQHLGDLLLTAHSTGQLSTLPHGETQIILTDYDQVTEQTIAIQPLLSWVQNAQNYYKKARKEKSKQALYEKTEAFLQHELAYLDEFLGFTQQAESPRDLKQIALELNESSLLKKLPSSHRKKPPAKNPAESYMTLLSSDGLTLYVGKSGLGNALLVGKLAQAHDIWLHVHQIPGSHVLIKTEGQAVPDQTLLEAAHLAAYYSNGRSGNKVPVIYSEMRYIKKIPNSYPGHVNYRQEKTVFITPDSQIIDSLLKPALSNPSATEV